MAENQDQYFSKTLAKGLKVLSLFNELTPVMTQTEISRTLGVNMTTTYRLINTLIKLGYLEKDRESKKIRLGLGALGLGATLIRTFNGHQIIRSLVDDAHDRLNVTVDVATVVEDALQIVYRREADQTLTYRLPSVSRSWHTTSLGKAYLAFLPEDKQRKTLDRLTLDARTPRSITNRRKLEQELAQTRKRGYAVADEEYLPGLITIGAPLINPDTGEAIGALSFDFSTLEYSVETMTGRFVTPLLELGQRISEAITTI